VDEFSDLGGAFLVMIRLVRVLRPLRAINRVPSKFNLPNLFILDSSISTRLFSLEVQ
jgi:hypothetical protein